MGLFDTIRSAVGGSGDDQDREAVSDLLDSTGLDSDDFTERAERLADRESLDFTVESLAHLDSLVADSDVETAGDGTAETTYTETTIELGSYLGGVLVEAYDGDWTRDEGWGVVVTGTEDDVTVKVFDVAVRSLDGQPVFAAVAERLESKLSIPDDEGQQSEPQSTDESIAQPDSSTDEPGDDGDTAAEPAGASEPAVAAVEDADETDDGTSQSGNTEATVSENPADLIAEAESDVDSAPADEATDEQLASESGFSFGDEETEPITESEYADDSVAASDPEPPDLSASGDGTDTTDTTADNETAPSVGDESDPSDAESTERPPDDPTAGDGLRADHAETAIDFAEFWGEHELDFTPPSLGRLDDLVDAEWDTARFADATFGSAETFDDRSFTSLVTELGSYFGEVLVRELDGEWTDETAHEAAVVVESPSGPLAIPVYKIATNSLRQTAVFAESYAALLEDLEQDESS